MKLPKADEATVALFSSLVPADSTVVVKPMFGQPAAFANGNLFFGVFGADLFVRLGDADRRAALDGGPNAVFAPMAGRPMREYVVLRGPDRSDRGRALAWVGKACAHAKGLPAKVPKRRRA